MVSSIQIGFRHCGKMTISVIVDYIIKSRQLNPTTVIIVVNVELLDGGEVKNKWCIRFLVPITEASHVSFHDFLDRFIRKVLITDSVLSSIGAFELMEFKNKISQIDFQQKQTLLHILKITCFSNELQSLNMMISILTLALTTNLTFTCFGLNKMMWSS